MVLDVEGSAADVESAFHTSLALFQHPTEARTFFAPETEPVADLAVPVLHVSGLDNFNHRGPKISSRPRLPQRRVDRDQAVLFTAAICARPTTERDRLTERDKPWRSLRTRASTCPTSPPISTTRIRP